MLEYLEKAHNKLEIKINATFKKNENNKEEEDNIFQKFVGRTSRMNIEQAIRQVMRRNTKL